MVKTFAKNRTGTKSKGQQTGERYWCPHAIERQKIQPAKQQVEFSDFCIILYV
jgi:hypothetical protein